MKKNRFIYTSIAASILLFASCSSEVETVSNPEYAGANEALVKVSLQFPKGSSGYALGDNVADGIAKDTEKEIQDIAFFAFTKGGNAICLSTEPLLTPNGFTQPLVAVTDGVSGAYTASFKIKSALFAGRTPIYAVANYKANGLLVGSDGKITAATQAITIGGLKALLSAAVAKDASISTPLLMTCRLEDTDPLSPNSAVDIQEATTQAVSFSMERIVSRVDVINHAFDKDVPANNFELVSVRLLNAPAQGDLFETPSFTSATYINTAHQTTITTSGLIPAVKQLLAPIYVYEGLNAEEATATRIEIIGRYKGVEYRKEIPFKTADALVEGTLVKGDIVAMTRNTRYVVNINPSLNAEGLDFKFQVADWSGGSTIEVAPDFPAPVLEGLESFVPSTGATWDNGSKTLNITDATQATVLNLIARGNQDTDLIVETSYDLNPIALKGQITHERGALVGYSAVGEVGSLNRTYKVTVPARKQTDIIPSSTEIIFFNTSNDQMTTTITVKYAPFLMTALKSSDSRVIIDQNTKLMDFTGAVTGSRPTVSFFVTANTEITASRAVNEGATYNFFTTSIADETDLATTQKYGPGKRITLIPKSLVTTPELASFSVSAGRVRHNFYAKSIKSNLLSMVMPSSNSNMIVEGSSIYLSVNNRSHGSIVYTFIENKNYLPSVTPQVTYATNQTSPRWANISPSIRYLSALHSIFNLIKREVTVTLPSGISKPAEVTRFIVPRTRALRLIPVYPSGSSINYSDRYLKPIAYNGVWWSPVNIGQTVISRAGDPASSGGYLFQWGRKESLRFSTSTYSGPLSSGNQYVSAGYFITSTSYPYDWLSSPDTRRWNRGSESYPTKTGNDPCPSGWRVPTRSEFNKLVGSQRFSYGAGNSNSCHLLTISGSSGLCFSAVGWRHNNGYSTRQGTYGYYWSSSVSSSFASYLIFNNPTLLATTTSRSSGMLVRCVQE